MYQERDDRIPIIDGGDFEQLQQQLAQAPKVGQYSRTNKLSYFPLTLDLNRQWVSTADLTVPVNTLILGINMNVLTGEEWILTGSIVKDKLSRGYLMLGGYFIAAYNTTARQGNLRLITGQVRFMELLLWVNSQNWDRLRPY